MTESSIRPATWFVLSHGITEPSACFTPATSVRKIRASAWQATAQAAEASARAEQAAADSVTALAEVEKVAAVVQADLEKLADDIHAELDQFKPTQGGYAYIKRH